MAAARGGGFDGESKGEDGEVYHRDNIFEFFRNHTAYDMLPESGKVDTRTHVAVGIIARAALMLAARWCACCSMGDTRW